MQQMRRRWWVKPVCLVLSRLLVRPWIRRGFTQGSASYRWLALGFVVPPLWGLSQEVILQTASQSLSEHTIHY